MSQSAASKTKTAAAYIRVSTDDQVELSPESQLEVIRKYAAANGYLLADDYIFADEGISGRTAAKRPGFNHMIAAAKENPTPFETVLLWKFSRFARNQEESVFYKAMLRREGVDVVSVSEPLAEGPFGSLIERILEWMDEYYSIRLSGEVKRSMTLNAQKGRLQASASFGYRVKEHKLVPVPEEAALVQEIFSRFIGGEGLYPIARWLNSMGVTTHRGSAFENRTVEYILRNPVYIGKLRWNPAGRTRRDYKSENIILSDGGHEPLVEESTWQAAQKRMDEVKLQWGYKARPAYELKDWASGLVRCAACGATLVFQRPGYFKCNNYVKGRCTASQHVKAELLHEAIVERLQIDCSAAVPLAYDVVLSEKHGANEMSRLRLAADTLRRKLERLRELYLNGLDDIETYKAGKEALENELAETEKQIAVLESTAPSERLAEKLKQDIALTLDTLDSSISTKEQKNAAIRTVMENCTFDKAQNLLSITYRIFLESES